MIRSTHTYAVLEISRAAYDEIAGKLRAAGYDQAFHETTHDVHREGMRVGEIKVHVIDMHGIALAVEPGAPERAT